MEPIYSYYYLSALLRHLEKSIERDRTILEDTVGVFKYGGHLTFLLKGGEMIKYTGQCEEFKKEFTNEGINAIIKCKDLFLKLKNLVEKKDRE